MFSFFKKLYNKSECNSPTSNLMFKWVVGQVQGKLLKNYSFVWTKFAIYREPILTNDKTITLRKWHGMDSEDTFYKGSKTKYGPDDIEYKTNSNGFRVYNETQNIKNNTILCFGCSNTFGTGLPDNETWPYILNEKLGFDKYKCVNLGASGASSDTIARLIYSYFTNHTGVRKPKAIVCLFPDVFRMEYFSSNSEYITSLCPHGSKFADKTDFINYHRFVNEEVAFFNFVKNFKFIETICALHKIELIWHTWSDFLLEFKAETLIKFLGSNGIYRDGYLYNIPNPTRARDGSHHGYEYQNELAKEFYIRIKSSNISYHKTS